MIPVILAAYGTLLIFVLVGTLILLTVTRLLILLIAHLILRFEAWVTTTNARVR